MPTLVDRTVSARPPLRQRMTLPWPLPAVLCWAAAWAVWTMASQVLPHGVALLTAAATAATLALMCRGAWRRLIAGAGFPLSALALGLAADVPAALWLVMALPLLLAYPLRAWRDAPFFPTPPKGLDGLAALLAPNHPPPVRILDVGCGLGHGLLALQRQWPQAQLTGLEWSAPLALLCAFRCRNARVARGDMWATSWAGYEMVYIFQRPESMERAWAKACAEMKPGSLLVSLEFVVPELAPQASLQLDGARPVWVYRVAGPGQDAKADSILANLGR